MATTLRPISRKLAEQALASIEQQHRTSIDTMGREYGPKLVEAWDGTHWAVCWDEGPFMWAVIGTEGGTEEEFGFKIPAAEDFPEAVFAEPYYGTVLMLYPKS